MLTHYGNTTFTYHHEFSNYMMVEGATLEDVFDYLFDVGARKFLSAKGKKQIHELFEKQDPKYLQLDEDFDDHLDNDGPEDIIEDQGMQNPNMNDQSCQH